MARAPALADTENAPEADRLDGFPHPRHTRQLFGHEQAEKILAEGLVSGRMHHGWLITGTQGIGKATLAYKFARAALSRPDDRARLGASLDTPPDKPASRQVAALSHPGLLVLRRGYDQKAKRFPAAISVDEVRRLRSFLSLSAEEGGWRVVIVDSADEMNLNAANALLKSLEEPPAQTIFLILSCEPGRLLATIRSRCRKLSLDALSGQTMRMAVRQAYEAEQKSPPGDADLAALAPLAGGSVRRTLLLAGSGGLQLQGRIEKIFGGLPVLDMQAAHQLADELQPAAAEQKFELFFELLFGYLGRLTRLAATGAATADSDAATLIIARRVIGDARVASFAQLWETLARDKAEALALNLDRKALILDVLTRIEAAARA